MTHRLYGVDDPKNIYQFEDCKDTPHPAFYGLTPRQAYIAVSETYVKPTHGKDFFGVALVNLINKINLEYFALSDGGLAEELVPLAEAYGGSNILVLQILRDGYTFEGDSRSYYKKGFLEKLGVKSAQVKNNSTPTSYLDHALSVLSGVRFFDQDKN